MDETSWFACFYCCFFQYITSIHYVTLFFLYAFVPGSHLMLFAGLRHCRSDKGDERWPHSYNSRAAVNDSDDIKRKKGARGSSINTGCFFSCSPPSLIPRKRAVLLSADIPAKWHLKITFFLPWSGCCGLIPSGTHFWTLSLRTSPGSDLGEPSPKGLWFIEF